MIASDPRPIDTPPPDVASALVTFTVDPQAERRNVVPSLASLLIDLDRRRQQQTQQRQQRTDATR